MQLEISMHLTKELGGSVKTKLIGPETKLLIYEDAIIGQNPKPEDTFTAIELMVPDTKELVYSQEPVQNSLWDEERLSDKDYYTAELVLIFSE